MNKWVNTWIINYCQPLIVKLLHQHTLCLRPQDVACKWHFTTAYRKAGCYDNKHTHLCLTLIVVMMCTPTSQHLWFNLPATHWEACNSTVWPRGGSTCMWNAKRIYPENMWQWGIMCLSCFTLQLSSPVSVNDRPRAFDQDDKSYCTFSPIKIKKIHK